MPRDYYEVLGVNRTASDDEIKKSYRKLVRDLHPDRNPGDKDAERRFKELQEAWDVLRDKNKRAQYDRFGFAGSPGPTGAGPGGFHWGGGNNIDPSQLDELLSGMFGQRGPTSSRSRRATRSEPVLHEIRLPFATAALGGSISISVNDNTLDVTIPAGVKEGQTLRLKGQAGGADLLLKVSAIDPHPHFKREGNDLMIAAPITIAEAILGTKIDVPTLDGSKLTVKVPAGTSSGAKRLRLRGKGIKGGDQYVEIKIVAPASVDERSRGLIEEFARLNPQNPRSGPPWE